MVTLKTKVETKVDHLKRRLSKDVHTGLPTSTSSNPSQHNGRFVLITPSTTYTATWIIRQFLSNGFRVRVTATSKTEAQDLRDTHSQYVHNLDVAVIGEKGGWGEVVRGVDGVVVTDLKAGGGGWRGVLEAVVDEGDGSVGRVVVTSSMAAVIDPEMEMRGREEGYVFTEKDWTSKSEEKALREFVRERNPNFTLASVCPAMVWGPLAHKTDVDGVREESSLGAVWKLMEGEDGVDFEFPAFADVRNVAQVHLRAYEHPSIIADGIKPEREEGEEERYIVSSDNVTKAQVCAALREQFPERRLKISDPAKMEDEGGKTYSIDSSKSKDALCMSFIGLDDCLRDMGQSLMEVEQATRKAVRYDGQEWFTHV